MNFKTGEFLVIIDDLAESFSRNAAEKHVALSMRLGRSASLCAEAEPAEEYTFDRGCAGDGIGRWSAKLSPNAGANSHVHSVPCARNGTVATTIRY